MTQLFAQAATKSSPERSAEFARRVEGIRAVDRIVAGNRGSARVKGIPAPRHGGAQAVLAGAMLDTLQPPVIAKKSVQPVAPKMHPKVSPLAPSLPEPAATLLSMIVSKADEAPGAPISFTTNEVACALDLAPAGAEALVGTLLRRGLIVESRNALGVRDGYRPSLPKA